MSDIQITEVGPRDGLQNEKQFVPTDIKLEFIRRLVDSGLKNIEATSFVSPKWVPQMADHEALSKQLPDIPNVHFSALVPNNQGLQSAIACGIKEIAVFAAASETFSQKNTNSSIATSLLTFSSVIKQAQAVGMRVRGYISCVLGCPYEGEVPLLKIVTVAKALYEAGCYEIAIGDTIGVGTPKVTQQLIKALETEIPLSSLAVHFHDTYGQALANLYACLELGVHKIDASVAGLGGCPYAKGASGNVATEEVVYLLNGLGLKTGIKLDALIAAGQYICHHLKLPNRSKVAIATLAKKS